VRCEHLRTRRKGLSGDAVGRAGDGSQGAAGSGFQDFPLLVDLKRPLSELMKIVPPAVSETLNTRFAGKLVNTGDHTPVPFVFWKIPPPW